MNIGSSNSNQQSSSATGLFIETETLAMPAGTNGGEALCAPDSPQSSPSSASSDGTLSEAASLRSSPSLGPLDAPTWDGGFMSTAGALLAAFHDHRRCNPTVHILSGALVSDPNDSKSFATLLVNEFGRSDSFNAIKRTLQEAGFDDVEAHDVTLRNYQALFDRFEEEAARKRRPFVVFNLCDGTETDGYPGISILREIERRCLAYTGATPYFYVTSTSKPELKKILQSHGVPTSAFVEIRPRSIEDDIDAAAQLVGWPMIVKPSVSYASLSISAKSVVHNKESAVRQALSVSEQPVGQEGVFVEKFLPGREFTALVVGDQQLGVGVFTVAERVFDTTVPQNERFLAFDRYWAGYGLDGSVPTHSEKIVWYAPAPAAAQDRLKKIARDAYVALGGRGYGRVDMRTDLNDLDKANIYVLEVNANCGMSFDTTSSLGEILHMSKEDPLAFARYLIEYALHKQLADSTAARAAASCDAGVAALSTAAPSLAPLALDVNGSMY